jgi:hypothetical protein
MPQTLKGCLHSVHQSTLTSRLRRLLPLDLTRQMLTAITTIPAPVGCFPERVLVLGGTLDCAARTLKP